jgi:hypothetical protein
MSLSSGVKAIDQERREQRNWDVDVQLASPASAAEVTALVARVPGVSRVEGWSRVPSGVAGPGRIHFEEVLGGEEGVRPLVPLPLQHVPDVVDDVLGRVAVEREPLL